MDNTLREALLRDLLEHAAANPGAWIFPRWDGDRITRALSQPPAPEQASGERNSLVDCGECRAGGCLAGHCYKYPASTAAPVAAKPACGNTPYDEGEFTVAAKPEQQAQAGEPEVVAQFVNGKPVWIGQPDGTKLVTLQSHREAMATESERVLRLVNRQAAEIAKKDAALQAGVELMQYMRGVANFERNDEIDAAITKMQEAMK